MLFHSCFGWQLQFIKNSSFKVKSEIWMKGCSELPLIQGILRLKGSAEMADSGNEPI